MCTVLAATNSIDDAVTHTAFYHTPPLYWFKNNLPFALLNRIAVQIFVVPERQRSNRRPVDLDGPIVVRTCRPCTWHHTQHVLPQGTEGVSA